MDFDIIPFEDIKGNWKKLGSGSFGNVWKGTYLGVDVAIKEVLPSNDYDVSKYFLRESTIMKEARHPNVVLYLGLSRAPPPDGRIFIISEFIENGNLRQYIYDKSKPFSWRVRLSFMTDIARALAYLHARKCIHRDLKGENLLVTSNGRLKITDFGFARIAARNEEESKRLTFCGTDSYMSPEILIGEEFDLPTDIFSLGIIFCEIIARRLADEKTFKRTAPLFGIEPSEVEDLASPGCPPELIALALECCATNPAHRPDMVSVLARLRAIELDVLSRPTEEEQHVGSIKFLSSSKRPSAAPRIPSFGMGVGKTAKNEEVGVIDENASDDSDEELENAVRGLDAVKLGVPDTKSWRADGWRGVEATHLSGDSEAMEMLIEKDTDSGFAGYSTTVIRGPNSSDSQTSSFARGTPSISSIMTVRGEQDDANLPTMPPVTDTKAGPRSAITIESYHTANLPSNMNVSIAAATEGGSNISAPSQLSSTPSALHHRFTLIKPGAKRGSTNGQQDSSLQPTESPPVSAGWSPFDFFFFSGGLAGTLGAKCDLCNKRLGFKALLECDDCGLSASKGSQAELTKSTLSSSHSHIGRDDRSSRLRPQRHHTHAPPPDYDDLPPLRYQRFANRSASAPPVLVSDTTSTSVPHYDELLTTPEYHAGNHERTSFIPFPGRT